MKQSRDDERIMLPIKRGDLLAFVARCREIVAELDDAIKASKARARTEARTRAKAQREVAAIKTSVKRARKVAKGLPR
jgi:hypothetical protein